jgi:GTP cyclohydrolase I
MPESRASYAPKARPSDEDAEAAVRTVIAYVGDDPTREGLLSTPKRILEAYKELYRGYGQPPDEILGLALEEPAEKDGLILVKDIHFNSHCEHHMMPFYGKAHIAYLTAGRVARFSTLMRLVDSLARRLQSQEQMTAQIASALEHGLRARGIAVMLEAVHTCMSVRGVRKAGALTTTTKFSGAFKNDPVQQAHFIETARGA